MTRPGQARDIDGLNLTGSIPSASLRVCIVYYCLLVLTISKRPEHTNTEYRLRKSSNTEAVIESY